MPYNQKIDTISPTAESFQRSVANHAKEIDAVNEHTIAVDLEQTKKKLTPYLNQDSLSSHNSNNGIASSSADNVDVKSPKTTSKTSQLQKDHKVDTNWTAAQMQRLLAAEQSDERYRSTVVPFDSAKLPLLSKSSNHLEDVESTKSASSKQKIDTQTIVNQKSFFKRLWDKLQGVSEEIASVVENGSFNPELDPPPYIDTKAYLTYLHEMKKLNNKVEELQREINEHIETNRNYAAAKVTALMNAVMSEMHNMQKHNQTLSLIEVTRNNHYQDKLRKEYYSLQKKSQELFKAGKVLNWVDGGVALATIALAVGAFATGGLTLWSGIAVGALSVAGGSTTISSGVLKFQGSKMEGKMFLRQEEVSEIARASKLAIDDSIEAVNQLPKIYRTAMQLNDAEHRLKKFE